MIILNIPRISYIIKFIILIFFINYIYMQENNMFQSKDYIYEIYRCGSFSAAARNLYITQPAISIAVKKGSIMNVGVC